MKIAEGRRTEVYLIEYRSRRAILKKPKAGGESSILREYRALSYLQALGIEGVPKVYELNDQGLIEEYIPGEHFYLFARKASKEELKRVILEALGIAFQLDLVGVRHQELSLAHKHILVADRTYLIDFGHSKLGIHRRSLPQLAAYIFFRRSFYELFDFRLEELKEALRDYKRGNPKKLLKVLTP